MKQKVQEIVEILQKRSLPSVKPEIIWNEGLDRKIMAIPLKKLSDEDERKVYAITLQAGLFLWNDSLSKAHDALQDPLVYDVNLTGDYWHAFMHRKEGDYNNSKMWMPTEHPIHEELKNKVESYFSNRVIENEELKASLKELVQKASWDAQLFVDIVEQQVKIGLDYESKSILENIQWIEMELLLNYSCQKSLGCGIFELTAAPI